MNNEYSPLEIFLNAPMIDYYRKHPEKFMEEILGGKVRALSKGNAQGAVQKWLMSML